MSRSPPGEKVYDLCSDEDAPPERHNKRHRKEDFKQKAKQQDQIIDLSMATPEGMNPPIPAEHIERRLWGEVEGEGPPRWNYARRRSSLANPSDMLPASLEPTASTSEPDLWQDGEELPQQPWPRRSRPSRQLWARHAAGGAVPASALLPEEPGYGSGMQSDELLAQRLQQREEAFAAQQVAAAQRAEDQARQIEEEELEQRINELEELEAMEENTCQRPNPRRRQPHRPEAPPGYSRQPALSQHSRSASRRAMAWAPASLAEAMMGMLSDGSSLAHMQLGALTHHVAAVRHAMGALQGPGRLPPHLLFSDRDFDENDYEALLALDDNVASRKGASSEQIESIPTVVVGHNTSKEEHGCRCPICLEDIEAGAMLRKLTCKHYFHKACLDKWLSHKSVCPICQQKMI